MLILLNVAKMLFKKNDIQFKIKMMKTNLYIL